MNKYVLILTILVIVIFVTSIIYYVYKKDNKDKEKFRFIPIDPNVFNSIIYNRNNPSYTIITKDQVVSKLSNSVVQNLNFPSLQISNGDYNSRFYRLVMNDFGGITDNLQSMEVSIRIPLPNDNQLRFFLEDMRAVTGRAEVLYANTKNVQYETFIGTSSLLYNGANNTYDLELNIRFGLCMFQAYSNNINKFSPVSIAINFKHDYLSMQSANYNRSFIAFAKLKIV